MRKLVLLLASCFAACGEEDTKLAETQITLTVNADDTLRAKLDNLRATLFVNEGGSWTQRSSVDVPEARLRWPLDIPIVARPDDASAQIEVLVEAYANAQRLAQARVVTRFTRDRVTFTSTQLFECSRLCAEDSCHGESCAVCSASGECIAVAPAETQDAGTAREEDASTLDSGRATVEDAGTPTLPTDASPTPTACPANACAAPYVCLPTPAGYTCRGQFADWPMPDKTPSSKVQPSYTATPDLVTDNVTKLQWQLGLPRVYPGCTEYPEWTDGTKGDVGELCTRPQGKAYCDNLVHGGFDDWRLPTVIELSSLYDPTVEGYQIDHASFADTDYGPFVSDSTYAGGPSQVWGVNYYAYNNYFYPNYSGKIRCVRAGAVPTFATPADRYLTAAEQVTDQATSLIWQRTPSATMFTGQPSDAGVPLLTTACTAPWRVPTINELLTLVDYTRSKPAINPDVFPNTPSEPFWGLPLDWAAAVSFETGELETYEHLALVRCVQ
ncbi:MAG TPA: DUF1566 domain-containing protein [Polyangiales bacterium]|nr:DUF1566 domain-containing protein [Polyangiales bacterium]